MEAVEYVQRPTTVKAYQFLRENANEFIEMLWGWNYLTRLGGSVLVFQPSGAEPGITNPIYRIHHGDYLIESFDTNGAWQIEVMYPQEFEKKYMPGFPENKAVE